ncbi:MAG: hypothetical protein HRU70_07525 [Phycisphaeraceae bacterium]|nr:MAG: hypothetical protein HRU70_07525 [Phycisphaeraceae bacterium]
MKTGVTLWACVAGILAGGATSFLVTAGPLDPPAGPVASTYKTLTEVEPRRLIGQPTSFPIVIQSPGSYYLASNIVGVSGQDGIRITADNVTLDLNGFTVSGVSGSRAGIISINTRTNVVVRNGGVNGWGHEGVNLLTATASRVEGVTSYGNLRDGIAVGNASVVEGCVALSNGTNGFQGSSSASFNRCVARLNANAGFRGTTNSILRDCIADTNGTIGQAHHGFFFGSNAVVVSCTSLSNRADGFNLGEGSQVTASTARSNATGGIVTSGNSVVTQCTASNNTGSGITVGEQSHVLNSIAASNGGVGVFSGNGAYIANNTARSNTLSGFTVAGSSYVLNNNSLFNGPGATIGNGITSAGSDSRYEGNNLVGNDFGLVLSSPGNLILRNSTSANGGDGTTDFSEVSTGNAAGEAIDVRTGGNVGSNGNVNVRY